MPLTIRLPYRHRRSLLGRFAVPPKRGRYEGRLAFDSKSEFHIDPAGRKIVTDHEGKTWRYARLGDKSHNSRYHQNEVRPITGTTEDGHGRGDSRHAHHFQVLPSDPHFGGVKFDLDHVAERITSHTDAYKEAAA